MCLRYLYHNMRHSKDALQKKIPKTTTVPSGHAYGSRLYIKPDSFRSFSTNVDNIDQPASCLKSKWKKSPCNSLRRQQLKWINYTSKSFDVWTGLYTLKNRVLNMIIVTRMTVCEKARSVIKLTWLLLSLLQCHNIRRQWRLLCARFST